MPAAVCKGLIVAELEHNAVVNKVYDLDAGSSVYAVNARADIEYRISARIERTRSLIVKAEVERLARVFAACKLIEIHMPVKRCVYDLDKAFLFARPVVHCAYVLACCLGPLDDKRLTRPAAAGPIDAVGIAQAACRFRPGLRERFAADRRRTVGCAAAEVIAGGGGGKVTMPSSSVYLSGRSKFIS